MDDSKKKILVVEDEKSISDIITNSSSEVFCTITGKDLEAIAELLKPLFSEHDSDLYPCMDFYDEDEWDEGYPGLIQISLPYGYDGITEFYRAGLKAILDQTIGENNYDIDYEF